ncbi:YtxH domain-containing protein [Nitrospira sp. M1]
MSRYDDRERFSLIPVLAGFFLGAGIALLLTPQTGPELRRDLNRRARSAKESVEETVEIVKEQGKEVFDATGEVIAEAKHAFEAGRDQVRRSLKT